MPAPRRTRRARAWRLAAVAFLLLLAAPTTAGSAAATAQPQTCPNPGPQAVDIFVAGPEAGATVSGEVTVTGTVSSAEPVFRVELFVGDARKDVQVFTPPAPEGSFTLVWDSGNRAPGPATLEVLACGGQPAQGSLIRGLATVDVTVDAPPGGTTTLAPLVPAGAEDGVKPLVWVGLVIGAAGLVGLAFAGGGARRSGPDLGARERA